VSRGVLPLLLAVAAFSLPTLGQQPVVQLWPDVAPGSEGNTAPESVRVTAAGDHVISSVHHPSLTVYLPAAGTATDAGVLVIPGGGHSEIWIDHEGYSVADWLSRHGVAAFVLKYRLARAPGSTYTIKGTELQDTQRALRLIRSRAMDWHLNTNRIGVMGFSAGGELAALASTRDDAGLPGATDAIDRLSSKPDFQALLYPAIPKDMRLSKETPAAFLACGAMDRPDISEGLPELYLNMKHMGVPAELHIFAGVGHGFGIRATNPGNVAEWPDLFYRWLDSSGFLKK
jgi:dienelactone hydrolase